MNEPDRLHDSGSVSAGHALVQAAGLNGEFPSWARCTPERRLHATRVSELMGQWAGLCGVSESERVRWCAAGLLHDALKDAPTEELREVVRGQWPDTLLHGPACADRIASEGLDDEELLLAISYHSTGHPEFGELGCFLYLADFLEPGRRFRQRERKALRARALVDRDGVLREVAALRLTRVVASGQSMLIESVQFWNGLVVS